MNRFMSSFAQRRRAPGLRVALLLSIVSLSAVALGACGSEANAPVSERAATPTVLRGTPITLRDTMIASTFEAHGVAEPVQQATLSTKLMGTVTAVTVHEGDVVSSGQLLVQIDARDLGAKANQVAASVADAQAMRDEAAVHAARFTALYQDSAATKAQFDAATTGLARADAALRAARAGAGEIEAVRSYASVRAPFRGMVTARHADIGSFAAPGMPLVTVQDGSTLRISTTAPANVTRGIAKGQQLDAVVDGRVVRATVEGVVPAGAGNLYMINALVPNRDGTLRAGSAASLSLPQALVRGIMVPLTSLVRDGDLVGVVVRANGVDSRRWVRVGATTGTHVEVTSGLSAGEVIVVPDSSVAPATSAGL